MAGGGPEDYLLLAAVGAAGIAGMVRYRDFLCGVIRQSSRFTRSMLPGTVLSTRSAALPAGLISMANDP